MPDLEKFWRKDNAEEGMAETLMPVSEDHILRQSELLNMRQVQDTLNRMGVAMQTMMTQVGEVRESVIRMEAQDVKQQLIDVRSDVKALGARLSELENERQQRRGALSLVEWLNKNLPWMVGLGSAAVAYYALGRK